MAGFFFNILIHMHPNPPTPQFLIYKHSNLSKDPPHQKKKSKKTNKISVSQGSLVIPPL